jgi:flagellar motor switch/type III secretory pathway protein FliN
LSCWKLAGTGHLLDTFERFARNRIADEQLMTVAPIELTALPHASAKHAADTLLAAQTRGALPERAIVEVAPLGAVLLAYAGILPPEEPVAGAVAFGVVRGRHRGRLSLDVRLTRALVAALVERNEPPILRRLGGAERGLVAGIVAVILDALGSDLGITLSPIAPPGPIVGALPLAIDVSAAACAGRVVLEVPPALLVEASGGPGWAVRAASLVVVGALELAVTRVSAGAMLELASGDAVVFDGVAPPGLDRASPLPARLAIGDFSAGVVLAADRAGEITVIEPFVPGRRSAGGFVIEKESPMHPIQPSPETMRALAAAPIEVVAEIGRVHLRGDEVLGLGPGAVITLAGVRGAVVSLRVGGEIWADGELVNVDGELGVRVTAVRRRELPAGG